LTNEDFDRILRDAVRKVLTKRSDKFVQAIQNACKKC
jgi:hypothetical protein